MPVTINGSTGISSPGGDTSTSLSTGLLTVTGSTVPANGMYLPSANTLAWTTNSTRNMTLDSSGKLGIWTASPQAYLHVQDGSGSANGTMWLGNSTYYGTIQHDSAVTGANIYTVATASGGGHIFKRGTTEQARIDSSGNLLVGTTSGGGKLTVTASSAGNNLIYFENQSTTGYGITVFCNSSNTTQRYFEGYSSSAAAQKVAIYTDGNVRIAAGSTYGNLSDASLKTDIVDASPKLADVCALRVRNFSTLEDSTSKYIGFIAQEFETVFPSLVTTSTDVYKDGREIKGIKESALIPILVKAIQELTQRLEALEAK